MSTIIMADLVSAFVNHSGCK